jgi:hypothetical protein
MTRKGGHTTTQWAPRVATFVEAWNAAGEHVVQEHRPHTEALYGEYLRWYLPRTRPFVTFAAVVEEVHVPSVRDTYPRHRDQDIMGSVSYLFLSKTICYLFR